MKRTYRNYRDMLVERLQNDPEEMEKLIELEVDGIFTDEPTLLRDVLAKQGLL